MSDVKDESVDLIVTSPPYPMIEMWDSVFNALNPRVGEVLADHNGDRAFEIMHQELDKTWAESFRVLKQGGFACINIGDATRTVGNRFQLYSNHARISMAFKRIGFDTLPVIVWRKQTNAPNKFMGSGTLPSGAYVTLEHEYILVFRKGAKRVFENQEAKLRRQRSAFFWEERNRWFSDVWFDLKGVSQDTNDEGVRKRSAAFPFELAYRLVNMYSIHLDLVLDPFLGTGTTLIAAVAACRNSIGIEIDQAFEKHIVKNATTSTNGLNRRIYQRFSEHFEFVNQYQSTKGPLKHVSKNYRFPVMTRQETEMEIPYVESIAHDDKNLISARYSEPAMLPATAAVTFAQPKAAKEQPGQLTLAF
jgi:DNA modification methylase